MSDFKLGEMNIDAQKKTFKGFVQACLYTTLFLGALLIYLWAFHT